MDLTEQMGNNLLRFGGKFIKGTADFMKSLLDVMEKNRIDDPNQYTIGEHIRNGGAVVMSEVRNELISDMKRHLTEQNVAFMFLDNNDGDNCQTLIICDKDQRKAEFITKMIYMEAGHNVELEKNEFINITPKNKIACVSGLEPHEYELFREKAHNEGLVFAATYSDDNKVNIIYNIDNTDKLNTAMRQMSWDLTGRNGDEYEAAYKTKVEAQEVIKQLHKKKSKPVYLVDAQNPERIMKLEKDAVLLCSYYDKTLSQETNFENAIRISMSDIDYVSDLGDAITKFEQPVIITEKEFRDREKVIEKKLPKLDKDWAHKESFFHDQLEEDFRENSAKMHDRFEREPDFSYAAYVESDVLSETDVHLDKDELDEIDKHIKETIVRVKTYEYLQPQSNILLKHLEDVKKQRTYEQARRKEDNERGKSAERELKQQVKEKDRKKDKKER